MVWIPQNVVDEIGQTAAREGVPRKTAIAAALWMFGTLSMNKKQIAIKQYLNYSGDEGA